MLVIHSEIVYNNLTNCVITYPLSERKSDMIIDLKQCVEILKENDNFLVLSHEHPDGDSYDMRVFLTELLDDLNNY